MRLPRGITKTPKGWRITVRHRGALYQKRFPPSKSLEDVETALRTARARHRAGRSTATGTLAADVTRYLESYYKAAPGLEERTRHLTLWRAALGDDTARDAITREDVSRVLHSWRAAGLSADTCNKRRAALLAFYNTIGGPGSPNPVRGVPRFRTAPPLPRGLPFPLITRALKRLPKCKTRARLKLMAYTGARPTQIRRLTADDWDDKRHTLILHATEKGAGTRPHSVPLSKDAQAALREFEDTDAWGTFASSPMGRMWKAAAIAVGLPADTRVYDLRHSFGTAIYRASGDAHAAATILGHRSRQTIDRYIKGAVNDRVVKAVKQFERATRRRKVS